MTGRLIATAFLLCVFGIHSSAQTSPQNPSGQNSTAANGVNETSIGLIGTCVGTSELMFTHAELKLRGVNLEDQKKKYTPLPESMAKKIMLGLLERMYADSFTNSWDYSLSLFAKCAQNMSKMRGTVLTEERLGDSMACFTIAVVGTKAKSYKSAGEPVQKVYDRFAGSSYLSNEELHSIVDKVYAQPTAASSSAIDDWKACMDSAK